jgi:hypothetical protein
MSPSLPSVRLTLVLALFAASLAACAAPRGDAVAPCPHCGDPVTRVGADGRAEVVPRLRIGSWAPASAAAPGHATR